MSFHRFVSGSVDVVAVVAVDVTNPPALGRPPRADPSRAPVDAAVACVGVPPAGGAATASECGPKLALFFFCGGERAWKSKSVESSWDFAPYGLCDRLETN